MLLSVHADGFAKLIAKSMRQRLGSEDGLLQSCIRSPRRDGVQHRLPYVRRLPVDQRDRQVLSTSPLNRQAALRFPARRHRRPLPPSVLFGHSGPTSSSSVHPSQRTGPLEGCCAAAARGGRRATSTSSIFSVIPSQERYMSTVHAEPGIIRLNVSFGRSPFKAIEFRLPEQTLWPQSRWPARCRPAI